jgi:hypothetical protein
MIGKGPDRKSRFYQGSLGRVRLRPNRGFQPPIPVAFRTYNAWIGTHDPTQAGSLCYATLDRCVVAIGFVESPKGDHHSTSRFGLSLTLPLHFSTTSLHFYVLPNFFTHLPNRTRR